MIKSLAETVHRFAIKIPKKWYKKPKYIVPAVVAFALISTGLILLARAADTGVQLEAENTTLSGQVSTVSDTTASGGKALKFGNGSSGSSGTGTTTNPGGGSLLKAVTSYDTKSNLAYSSYGSSTTLDLYIPKGSGGPYPLIVYIHGGGWWEGDKSDCTAKDMGMMQKGYAVACINYRLDDYGKVPMPAQIIDVKAAVRFLRANASTYSLFADKIGVWGDSAGGHLAAMAGVTNGLKQFEAGDNLQYSSSVQAAVDFYGTSDFTKEVQEYTQYQGSDTEDAWIVGGDVLKNPDKAAAASPMTYVDSTDVPFMIYHGTSDSVVPLTQSQILQDALTAAGVKSTLHILQGAAYSDDKFKTSSVANEISNFFDPILR